MNDLAKTLLKEDKLILRNASYYDSLPQEELRLFCHHYARYCLPTQELIDWLNKTIKGKKAIEIGSGAGDLGYHLGIPMTDNWQQQLNPEVKQFYDLTRQPTIKYGKDVEKLDALEAISKYKPEIVIGAWVTQWINPNLPPPPGGGNIWGVKEEEILKSVNTYILIGSEKIHSPKQIMRLPHQIIEAPFVRSRRSDNFIWIWQNEKNYPNPL